MSKFYRARALLYRRQILQQNIRWKALDEIYKIYTVHAFAPLRPQYFRKFSSNVFAFFGNILQKFVFLNFFSLIFAQILMKFCRNFADILENVENIFLKFLNFLAKIPEFNFLKEF